MNRSSTGRRIGEDAPWVSSAAAQLLAEQTGLIRESFEQFASIEQVCHGGQGIVFRALERSTNRTVAVKVLLDGPLATARQRTRFEREVELIARLRHPNIVALYGCGEIRGRLYFTMEFVDGHPIDDYALLHDLTPREIVALTAKVCRAVHYAHQNGVIHRDLTPSNILVDAIGEPRVFDFGLAKDLQSDGGSVTQHIVGTLPFMSPEQAGGLDGRVDVRTDTYALGVILYHLLTESFPYPIDGPFERVREHLLNTPPTPLRRAVADGRPDRMRGADQITRDLEAILDVALAKAKEDRYQTALAFAEELERFLSGAAVHARSRSPYYRFRKALRRHWLAASVASTIGVIAVAAGLGVTTAWVRASADRDRAQLAAGTAFEMFSMALREVEQSMARLPGGAPVRDRVIAALESKLPALTKLGEDQAELAAIRALLAERRGELAQERGDQVRARYEYEQFLAFAERAAASPSPVSVSTVIRAYEKLAPETPNPSETFRAGLTFSEQAIDADPASPELRFAAASLRVRYAAYLGARDDLTSALDNLDRAESLCAEAHGPAAGEDASVLMSQAVGLRGKILSRLDAGPSGLAALERAVALARDALRVSPADAHARVEAMQSCARLADVLRNRGRPDEARAYYEEGAHHGELLALLDGSTTSWAPQRFIIHHELATLGWSVGDVDLTREHVPIAAEIAEQMLRAGPADPAALARLACADLLQGRLALTDGEVVSARCLFERAAAVRERLLSADTNNLRAQKDLSEAYFWLGSATKQGGAPRDALPYYRRYCDLTCELAQRAPESAGHRLDFVKARQNLAAALMSARDSGSDREASDLLNAACDDLDALDAAGQLSDHRGELVTLRTAIRKNLAILEQR